MNTVPVSKADVEKFLTICSDLRAFYMHYRELFEPGNPHDAIFGATAPMFFGDINLLFVKQIILEVCKLGDPARDSRGNENLSIDLFMKHSHFSGAPAEFDNLKSRATTLRHFISKLKPARDKLLSHWDRHTVLTEIRGLGSADNDEWANFWLDLQMFVAILCERYIGERIYFCGGVNSDAGWLVETLRRSEDSH